jgi:hypothetical protein
MTSPKFRLPWTSTPPGRSRPILEQWTFVPSNSGNDPAKGAYLQRGSEQVMLAHSSRLLADFLQTIRQIEDDFTRRCDRDRIKTPDYL